MIDREERLAEARGLSVVFETCAALFLNEPSETVVTDIELIASTLGIEGFDTVAVGDTNELTQRYYDRLFVTTSPLFVPLIESSVACGGRDENGTMHYGTVESARSDHTLRCYQTVGFDYRNLMGFEPAVANLHPDSIAAELAFLAFCKRREVDSYETGDDAQASHWAELALRFAQEHASQWISKAADCLASTDDDLYAHGCRLAASAVESLRENGTEG